MRSKSHVDFHALRQRIQIEPVCDLLGIQLKKTGEQLRGSCAICGHDSTRCFVVTPKLQRFWCFGHCRSGGDCIELVARVKQMSHKDAARFLADHFRGSS